MVGKRVSVTTRTLLGQKGQISKYIEGKHKFVVRLDEPATDWAGRPQTHVWVKVGHVKLL